MSQPTSRSTIKAIACSKPTISENLSKWKPNGIIADRCKQRWALCHIGLAKDRGDRLVNQPRLSLFDKCCETTVGDQISIMKREQKTNECRTWWKFFSPTFFSEFDERKNFEIRDPRPKKGPLSERQRWADQRQCQANFWLAKILTSRHLHRTHAQSRDEHGSDWMRLKPIFGGSGLDRSAIFLKFGGCGMHRTQKNFVVSMWLFWKYQKF